MLRSCKKQIVELKKEVETAAKVVDELQNEVRTLVEEKDDLYQAVFDEMYADKIEEIKELKAYNLKLKMENTRFKELPVTECPSCRKKYYKLDKSLRMWVINKDK